MSVKDSFSEDQWKAIVAAAPMVGVAVASASPNGPWGVMKEMMSVGMAMAEVVNKGSSNQLITALTDDVKARATKPERPRGISNSEEAIDMALTHLKGVADSVDSNAGADAEEFKKWLLGVGHRVAEATNEGGFFGFGGTKVSDEEKQMLTRLAQTLGVTDT